MQLARVIKGPQRTLAVRAKAVSAAATTGIGLLSKLTARVWFLSPPSVMRAEHGPLSAILSRVAGRGAPMLRVSTVIFIGGSGGVPDDRQR